MKRVRESVIAALILAMTLPACRSAAPGEDELLVRAEQTYESSRDVFNLVFTIEDKTQPFLEAKIPGTHATVEDARVKAKQVLPSLLSVIDRYKAGESADRLTQILATVDQAVSEVQKILDPPETMRRAIGVGEILAILTAAKEIAAWIKSQQRTNERIGGWSAEERGAVDATWTQLSTSHAWLTDAEGGQ